MLGAMLVDASIAASYKDYTKEQVAQWLVSIEFEEIAPIFVKSLVTGTLIAINHIT